MLTLAQELGVEDLQNTCEEHITSTMSVLNACTFLAAAMDIQDRASSKYTLWICSLYQTYRKLTKIYVLYTGGKGAKSFVDRCVSFIGENAAKCVKTNTFLNLPKESLIKLISSDCVCNTRIHAYLCFKKTFVFEKSIYFNIRSKTYNNYFILHMLVNFSVLF